MPYQIKNGIIYSGNAVTLTQAQYDALTTAEKNNGTVYYIYDSDAMIEAQEVGLDGGNVEDLAGSVATIETSPATANHSVGEYILWNGVLYTVTSAIATGENLVVNSNISATTVGEELTALNKGLTNIQRGTGTVTSVTTSTKTQTVTFDEPFANVPTVVVCLGSEGSYNRRINVGTVTVNDFVVECALLSGSTSATIRFNWIAVGN